MTPDYARLRRGALIGLLVAVVACAWLAPLDHAAGEQIDAGLKRALITFAGARALNALISVAQGTEVAVEPGGVGMVFTPGQALDPLNDLVEQFGNLMLAASVAFGVQKALLAVGSHWLASALLSAAALVWGALRLRGGAAPWTGRLLIGLLLIRFAIPLAALGSDLLYREFLADDYRTSQQALDATTRTLPGLAPDTPPADSSLSERLKGWWERSADFKASFEKMKAAAEQTAEHVIRLMVIFLVQTLVFPLALVWGLYRLALAGMRAGPRIRP